MLDRTNICLRVGVSILMLLSSMSVSKANGLLGQLECLAQRNELASFNSVDGYDVSFPVGVTPNSQWNWEEVRVNSVEKSGQPAIVEFDEFPYYRFLRFKMKPNHLVDYATNTPGSWECKGWNAALNIFRIGDKWFMVRGLDGHPLWIHRDDTYQKIWKNEFSTLSVGDITPIQFAPTK